MCRISSLFLVNGAKRSVSGDARDFNNIETRAVIKFCFSLLGKAPKEIHAVLVFDLLPKDTDTLMIGIKVLRAGI